MHNTALLNLPRSAEQNLDTLPRENEVMLIYGSLFQTPNLSPACERKSRTRENAKRGNVKLRVSLQETTLKPHLLMLMPFAALSEKRIKHSFPAHHACAPFLRSCLELLLDLVRPNQFLPHHFWRSVLHFFRPFG